jgi:5-methylcytosine-specific restriction endonuclease McrA
MRDWMNLTMFGIKYEVDHIIPIRGNKVSGLHVPSNLQIIKAQNNAIKGNQYEIR